MVKNPMGFFFEFIEVTEYRFKLMPYIET